MDFEIIYSTEVDKQFSKIDNHQQKIIRQWIATHLSHLQYPKQIGKQLKVTLGEYWSYRIGQYRLICIIDEELKTITIVSIGHRREVYHKMVREPETIYI